MKKKIIQKHKNKKNISRVTKIAVRDLCRFGFVHCT